MFHVCFTCTLEIKLQYFLVYFIGSVCELDGLCDCVIVWKHALMIPRTPSRSSDLRCWWWHLGNSKFTLSLERLGRVWNYRRVSRNVPFAHCLLYKGVFRHVNDILLPWADSFKNIFDTRRLCKESETELKRFPIARSQTASYASRIMRGALQHAYYSIASVLMWILVQVFAELSCGWSSICWQFFELGFLKCALYLESVGTSVAKGLKQ